MPRRVTLLLVLLAWSLPAGAADLIVVTESRLQSDRVWRDVGEPLDRLRITQGLELHVGELAAPRPDRPDLIVLDVSLRVDSDLLRGVVLDAPDVARRQAADVRLRQAALRIRPSDALELTLGRQLLWAALPARDIDGARIALSTPADLDAWVAVGREVRLDPLTVDGAFFERLGGRYAYDDDPEPAEAVLTELGAAWETRPLRLVLAHRETIAEGRTLESRSGAVLRLRFPGAARLAFDLRGDFEHREGLPNHLDAALQLEPGTLAGARSALRLGWSYRRPDLDPTSVFAAFDALPSVAWDLDARLRAPDWGVSLGGRLRAYGGAEGAVWDGGWSLLGDDSSADELAAGGSAAFDWRPAPLWALTLRGDADAGYGGLLLAADASARWEPLPERMALSVRVRHAYEDSTARAGHTLAGRLGFGYRLGRLGSARAWYEYVATHLTPARFTLMAAFDFDLDVL